MKLRVTGINTTPFLRMERIGSSIKYSGIMGEFMNTMIQALKLNITFVEPKEKLWGLDVNGTWNGMIGTIQRKEADLGIGAFAMTSDRFKVIDFSPVIWTNYAVILAGKHMDQSSNILSYTVEFTYGVYIVFTLSFIAVLLIVVTGENMFKNKFKAFTFPLTSCLEKFWMLVTTMCSQSHKMPHKRKSTRIILSFWLLALIVLTTAFSGDFKASVILGDEVDRIDSIEDILKIPSLRVVVRKESIYDSIIQESKDPSFKALRRQIIDTNGQQKNILSKKILKDILHEKAVVFSNFLKTKAGVSKACEDFKHGGHYYFSKKTYFPHMTMIPFRKDLSTRKVKKINKLTRRIFESGLFQKWMRDSYRNLDTCKLMNPIQEETGTLDTKYLFYMWLSGLGMATFILLLEMAYVRYNRIRYKTTKPKPMKMKRPIVRHEKQIAPL